MNKDTSSRYALKLWLEAFRSAVTTEGFLLLSFAVACIGLYYGKAMLSISTGVIFGIALLNGLMHPRFFHALLRYRVFLAIMGIWGVYLLSGMHSDNTMRWLRLVRENAPYLMLPIGFFAYRNLPASSWIKLLWIFISMSALSALCVMTDYAIHFRTYNELYKVGKSIPVPVIHVRYSFFMALAALVALSMWYEAGFNREKYDVQHVFGGKRARTLMLVIAVFLVVVVHLLAVRTGLISLYGGLGVMFICIVLKDRQWKLGLAGFAGLVMLLVLAWYAFPSVQNKIAYVLYDLRMMKEQGAIPEYSDNVRITSIRNGLALLHDHLITGTGIGDLKAETQQIYAERTPDFPVESRYPPISQYVFIFTAFGVVGGALFFFFLIYPLFRTPFHYILLGIYTTTLFASIGETTIELQLGKSAFVSLVCIALLYIRALSTSRHTS